MKKKRGEPLYPYVLEHKPGFFLGWLLYRFFKKVTLDENLKEDLKQMQREGTVVYAIKYRGLLDYLLYHYTFRRKRLPYPKIAFNINILWVLPLRRFFEVIFSQMSAFFKYGKIPSPFETGFYRRAITRRSPALISLLDPEGFTKSFVHSEKNHLQFLLETQKGMERPIFIVPQLIIFSKKPEREYSSLADIFFGYKDNIGLIRKIILFSRHYSETVIDFGSPVNLKTFLESQPPERRLDDMATELKRDLIESIDSQKRIILGPIMKSRQQFKEIVLRDRDVIEQIEKTASGDLKRLKNKRKRAGKYFDEIAADYNSAYVDFFRFALKWLWKRIFEGIDVDQAGAAKVRQWARRGPLIYIPSHKSHIDYLILNYVLYDFHIHVPRIAAGQNLAFWPMGHIFRKSGAFFIRRTFRGARLYSEVFSRYIKALLEDGHPIEFYIEGGRSRNGKLVLPKTGFLSILLQAYREGFCKDLIFVPTSIIYDRIIEEDSYLKEIGGGGKEKENLKHIIRAGRFLKGKYGKIYIRFNEPFSLTEYISQKGVEVKDIIQDLAFHLVHSINEVSLVTPLSLIATAILTNHRKGFYISELQDTVDTLLDFLERNEIPVAGTLNDPAKATLDTLSLLISWKVVNVMEDVPWEEEAFYFVDEDKKIELEYYKNNIIHFFIHHSFVAISFLKGMEEVKEIDSVMADYILMKDIFRYEFIFEDEKNIRDKLIGIIEYFIISGLLTPAKGNQGYRITKSGFDRLPFWAALGKTFIESYWITAKAMGREKKKMETGENLLKKIGFMGKRYYRMGSIDHIEALSQINFKNAITIINKRIHKRSEYRSKDGPSEAEVLSQFIKTLHGFLNSG